jgi:hypothetical protein
MTPSAPVIPIFIVIAFHFLVSVKSGNQEFMI